MWLYQIVSGAAADVMDMFKHGQIAQLENIQIIWHTYTFTITSNENIEKS